MGDYRKILVAFDGSPSAVNAVKQACRLAKAEQSWVKVLAVLPTYEGDLEFVAVGDLRQNMEEAGRKLVEQAKVLAGEVAVLADVAQGEPYERIVRVAEEENCDLIVMGRRGLSRLERDLIGGVTARVIGHTGRDVLVVPEQAQLDWSRLLLATDGSPFSAMAVTRAISLAARHQGQLSAVSVAYTNDEFYALAPSAVHGLVEQAEGLLAKVGEQGKAAGVTVNPVVRQGEPFEAICALAEELDSTLIIMGSHGRKGLTRLLMGSVTEHVVGLAHCPVLINHSAVS